MSAEMPSPGVTVAAPAKARAVPTFDEVYQENVAFLFRAARGFGVAGSAAEDVMQDVFVVVHRRLGEFDGTGSLRAWLLRVLMNVVREHRRRFRRKGDHDLLEDEAAADPNLPPDEQVALAQAARLLGEILASMPDDQREVFVLSEIEGVPIPEIAEAAQINVNTAYSRLRLARATYDAHVARIRAKNQRRAR